MSFIHSFEPLYSNIIYENEDKLGYVWRPATDYTLGLLSQYLLIGNCHKQGFHEYKLILP